MHESKNEHSASQQSVAVSMQRTKSETDASINRKSEYKQASKARVGTTVRMHLTQKQYSSNISNHSAYDSCSMLGVSYM